MPKNQWIDFTAIREALDFPTVLEHYDIDHPSGQNQFKVNCPFHEDSSPSCSINADKSIFKCFGCNTQGNVLEFVIYMEQGDPANKDDMVAGAKAAVEILGRDPAEFGKQVAAKKPKPSDRKSGKTTAGAKTTNPKKATSDAPSKLSPTSDANQKKNVPFDRELKLEHEHPFLVDRGIDPELAEAYGIGFCNAGIMKDRIAIPIHNLQGQIMAYVGRYANEEIPDGIDRYRFPKRFYKSVELFNLHRAAAMQKRYLVLVEGYWSAIRLNEMGIPCAALMGTSASTRQAELVREAGFQFVTLLMDGDDAGRKAAPENAAILSQHVYVRALDLPDGEKPDTVSEDFLEPFRK